MEDRRGCFGRRDYVSQSMALPMCHREGEQRKRWKKKKSQQQQQQQQQNRVEQQQHRRWRDTARGRQLTGEWSRASHSSLIRPAFPRLASPLLRRPFFSADEGGGWLPPFLVVALSRPPDIYVTFTSRFNAPAYVADGSHCVHPRADLSAWKMFLIRGKKKEKHARDEFVTFRWQIARDFFFNCRSVYLPSRFKGWESRDQHRCI